MGKYHSIKKQLRTDVGKENQSEVESSLNQIEREALQDDFCDNYIRLHNTGFSPYDCLVAYMKGAKYR